MKDDRFFTIRQMPFETIASGSAAPILGKLRLEI
jgi:hypothetical protein